MERNITNFAKIFGSGPIGLLISLILFVIAIVTRPPKTVQLQNGGCV